MEVSEGPRPFQFVVYFFVASVLLYLGIGVYALSPGGYDESRFDQLVPFLFLILPALFLTCRIAWLLRRPGSDQLKGRSLWLTLPLSLGVVLLEAVLISLVIFRQQWGALFWTR
jgi:hypothetical protein